MTFAWLVNLGIVDYIQFQMTDIIILLEPIKDINII